MDGDLSLPNGLPLRSGDPTEIFGKPIEISALESFQVSAPMPPLPKGAFTAVCQCGSRTEKSEVVYAGDVPFVCVICSEKLCWRFDQ